MTISLPKLYLIRHGETEWSLSGKHTGRTDIELTERGKQNAADLRLRLLGVEFAEVFTSPLIRAHTTCTLAGFSEPTVEPNLMEWDYGKYEGMLSSEIRSERPEWNVFFDGCPAGESPADVTTRVEAVLEKVRGASGTVAVFSHGHLLRALAGCWLGLGAEGGRNFILSPATVCILSYNHNRREEPVIELWNDSSHLRA